MSKILVLVLLLGAASFLQADEESLTPENKLKEGNNRFVMEQAMHPNQAMIRVQETSKGQKPFAAVVICSDSRVPPEVIFDQGIGDLFVIRTAGASVGPLEVASVEFAIQELQVPLLVVLGHKKCGAVGIALQDKPLSPALTKLARMIKPSIAKAKKLQGDVWDNAVREHVHETVNFLEKSEIIFKAAQADKLRIFKAYYDIDTGKITNL